MRIHRVLICILFFSALFLSLKTNAQDKNVTITDDANYTPQSSAMLDVKSETKGFLTPRVDNTSNVVNPVDGLLVFQKSDHKFYYYNGDKSKWMPIGGGGGGTLDNAYNFGGGGAGRLITADSGSVFILCPRTANTGTSALTLVAQNNDGYGLLTQFSGISGNNGAAILANNLTDHGNAISASDDGKGDGKYSTLQVTTTSNKFSETTNLIGGISASSLGNVPAIIAGADTSMAAVYAINFKKKGGSAFYGNGHQGFTGDGYQMFLNDTSAAGAMGTGFGFAAYGIIGQTTADGQSVDNDGIGVYARNNMFAEMQIQAKNDITSLHNIVAGVDVVSYGRVIAQQDIYAGVDLTSGGYLASVLGKEFRIDNPFDPANKYLVHFSVESPEILNMYRGNVVLNADGEATITLPYYFSEINTNYSYNLTSIGAAAPGLYVKTEVNGNTFAIAGGKPNMKVSWTLYAERNDKIYREHPEYRNNEPLKADNDKGKYLRPELFGEPKSKSMFYFGEKITNIKDRKSTTLPQNKVGKLLLTKPLTSGVDLDNK